jgi:adenylyltransferase/sulfurtransferase
MLQASEAVKLILGCGEPLVGRLLLVDSLAGRFTNIVLRKDPGCVACGTRELRELVDYDALCGVPGRGGTGDTRVLGVTPRELEAWQTERRHLALLDVRERWEWDLGRIAGATLIPLGELARAIPQMDAAADTVVYCHHGVRSHAAAERLLSLGFRRVYNLLGGIDAWSTDVDPGVPRY